MDTARDSQPKRRRTQGAPPGAAISAGELYGLVELKRRLGVGEHGLRTLRRAGLRIVRVGSQGYALGSDVLDLFRRLAEEQDRRRRPDGGEGT